LKILQVVQKPQRRGAEVFASQLSRKLRSMRHSVWTAYLYPHTGQNAIPLTDHDTVLDGRERHCFETFPGIHPTLRSRLRRLIDDIRPDVVQVNGGRTVKYGAAVASVRSERSWVLIYRNIGQPHDWVHGWRHAFYSRVVMPRLDGVVGVSHGTLRSLQQLYRLAVPSTFIPCAVDPDDVTPTIDRDSVRRQAETPLDAPVIVWAGSLAVEKRVDRLIRAAETVRQTLPNLHLWIVGDGPLRRTLDAQLCGSPLAPAVRFLGVQDQVANYISAGDVVCLPSDTEGMPAVLLEAGLLGRAVVATRVGGVSECVLDGTTGLLVEAGDKDGLARALSELLQRPDLRCRFGSAARAWIEQHFTMGRIAEQYCRFYRHVLAR
jgi:glycosyltransferase involved in cell wall biosynthesis